MSFEFHNSWIMEFKTHLGAKFDFIKWNLYNYDVKAFVFMMNVWTENEFYRIGEKEKNNMFIYYLLLLYMY